MRDLTGEVEAVDVEAEGDVDGAEAEEVVEEAEGEDRDDRR